MPLAGLPAAHFPHPESFPLPAFTLQKQKEKTYEVLVSLAV